MPAHRRTIDEKEVIKYALAGCYTKTISRLTGIPEETLRRRCGDLISKKRAERKYNLRVQQNDAAKKGNPALLIFLGKNELNQADKQELSGPGGGAIPVSIVDFRNIPTQADQADQDDQDNDTE